LKCLKEATEKMQKTATLMNSLEEKGYDYGRIVAITKKCLRIASFLQTREFDCDFIIADKSYTGITCGRLAAIVTEIARI